LKRGKYIWFINGNISKDTSFKIAETGMNKLNLRWLENKYNDETLKVDAVKSYRFEIETKDPSNFNSAIISHF
jgi:hypothetical protein